LGAKAYRRPGRRKLDSYQEFGKGVEMAGKFEITKDHAGKFRFHLKAPNGEIIAASQGYESKANAEKGIEAIKTHTRLVPRWRTIPASAARGTPTAPAASNTGMDDDECQALRAEGLDPDDPAVIAALDLVRWELSLGAAPTAATAANSDTRRRCPLPTWDGKGVTGAGFE
jgi:uncharacterized protein YegP (UPF0339 family)